MPNEMSQLRLHMAACTESLLWTVRSIHSVKRLVPLLIASTVTRLITVVMSPTLQHFVHDCMHDEAPAQQVQFQHSRCSSACRSEEISYDCRPECDLGTEQACNECQRQREQHYFIFPFPPKLLFCTGWDLQPCVHAGCSIRLVLLSSIYMNT